MLAQDDRVILDVQRHERVLFGDVDRPGLVTRVVLLEDFVRSMKRLGWIITTVLVGIWVTILLQGRGV
jgi:hypothetical protein